LLAAQCAEPKLFLDAAPPKRAAEAGFDEPLPGGQAVDWNDFRIF
jgi:hypothetical protein